MPDRRFRKTEEENGGGVIFQEMKYIRSRQASVRGEGHRQHRDTREQRSRNSSKAFGEKEVKV